MKYYRLGIAGIASELPLTGLPEVAPIAVPDIRVTRGVVVALADAWRDDQSSEIVPDWATIDYFRSADGRWHRIRYDYRGNIAEFAIREDGAQVVVETAHPDAAEVANLIEGPILGRAMRLAGCTCLHATALSQGDRAIALMGASGVGKSSLAWALVRQGCRLVTDDMVALARDGDAMMVQPGRARLRLWPDSAERLGLSGDSGTLFPTTTEMAKVGVHDPALFDDRPVRLDAIYRVLPRDPALAQPTIAEMPVAERLAELASNLHGMLAPGREGRRRELAWLASVAGRVPVRTLILPDRLDALPGIAAALIPRLFA
ncbi:MAG: hypothetical protein ABW182_15030 [Sphingomonas sp.]